MPASGMVDTKLYSLQYTEGKGPVQRRVKNLPFSKQYPKKHQRFQKSYQHDILEEVLCHYQVIKQIISIQSVMWFQ